MPTPQQQADEAVAGNSFSGAGLTSRSFVQLARLSSEAAELIGRYDHVTRLPNRLEFIDNFSRLRGGRRNNRMLVLLTLDDAAHYGGILRALGHAFAEDFVRAGARLLGELLPDAAPVYHVGNLSFAFAVNAEGADAVPPLVTEIINAFAGPVECNGIPMQTHIGVGLLPLSPTITDAAEALRATLAAAQDSRDGTAGFAFYDHHTDTAQSRALRLLADLPAALAASDQLALNFQPRFDLASGQCVGAEALLRWNHPQMGPITPGEFVPLAEKTAFITPLTDWVFRAALRETRRFTDNCQPLKISVNVSPLNLAEPGFDEHLLDLCLEYGVSAPSIELEFTEGVLSPHLERGTRHLAALRQAGIEIAIDDYGSGNSSLTYLTSIEADILKLDQSFVRMLGSHPPGEFLVRQLVTLAKGLGFRLCAEGIETEASYRLLQAMGCDEGQGYLLARPMSADAFESWFSAHRLQA